MGDIYIWACPKCSALIGGWNLKLPSKCPACGERVMGDDDYDVYREEGKQIDLPEWERIQPI